MPLTRAIGRSTHIAECRPCAVTWKRCHIQQASEEVQSLMTGSKLQQMVHYPTDTLAAAMSVCPAHY